jgi:hypothetical protein
MNEVNEGIPKNTYFFLDDFLTFCQRNPDIYFVQIIQNGFLCHPHTHQKVLVLNQY